MGRKEEFSINGLSLEQRGVTSHYFGEDLDVITNYKKQLKTTTRF